MIRIRSRNSSIRLASALLVGMAIAPLTFASIATAKTPFTKATITQLRNSVRLKPQNAELRPAKSQDILTPGDQVATGRAAFAEFRFNEGTLARMGERAIFRFIPRSRNFVLNKGTVLLLIPPGQGKTRVQTPNVRTGISGSALFIRHDEATNRTIVGALTDSGIEVSNLEDGPAQVLKAGQMVVAVDGEIEGFYDFDLKTFFESSPLTEGILQGEAGSDKVLQEIRAGLKAQGSNFAAASPEPVMETPSFIKLSEAEETESASKPLETGNGLEISPLENLAAQDSSIFPGRSLGLSVEAENLSETPQIPTEPEPEILEPESEIPEQDIPEPEPEIPEPEPEIPEPEPEIPEPEPEIPEPDIPEPEPEIPEPEPEIPEPDIPEPEPEIPEPEPEILEPEPAPDDGFPGQGNGVIDGFPGQGNGVVDGFPGGNGAINDLTLDATVP